MIISIIVYLIIVFYVIISILFFIKSDFKFLFNTDFIIFLSGFIVFISMRLFIKKLREYFEFLETFIHENTHLFFAFLTFKRVQSFHSSIKGGQIRVNKINPLIVLSPYTIPLIPIIFALLMMIIKERYYTIAIFFIGLSYAQFIFLLIKDIFTTNQPDIKVYGSFLSYMLILFSLLFFIILIYILLNYGINKPFDILVFFIEYLKKL